MLEARVLLSGSIQGCIWTDQNANGIWDAPDGRAAGWTVYLDQNNNGQVDSGETAIKTDGLGWYSFTDLPAGAYTVRYVGPDATWHAAPRQPDHLTVSLADGQQVTGQCLGVTCANGQISGTLLDAGQATPAPIEHWGVYFDLNNNGKIDPGEPWTSTDASGHFTFDSLPAGAYTVRVDPLHPEWSVAPGSPASFTIVSDGQHASSPITFEYQQDPPPARYDVNQLVDYLLIGGGSSDASARMINQVSLANGWSGFVSNMIQTDLAWGVKRIELHNPFGILPTDTIYPADQFLEAQNAGLHWLTDDFVQAWKPVTASGVEVIGYIGNPEYDASFQPLVSDPAAWQARFDASVAPLVQAGMSIAFDMGQGMTQGDLFTQALDRLRAQGVKVYLETRPPEFSPYQLTFPVINVNGFDANNPYVDPQEYWGAKNSELAAGVLQLIQSPPPGTSWTDRDWLIGATQSIMRDGDSVGIATWVMREAGVSLDDVLTPPAPATAQSPSTPSTPVSTTGGTDAQTPPTSQPVLPSPTSGGSPTGPSPNPGTATPAPASPPSAGPSPLPQPPSGSVIPRRPRSRHPRDRARPMVASAVSRPAASRPVRVMAAPARPAQAHPESVVGSQPPTTALASVLLSSGLDWYGWAAVA